MLRTSKWLTVGVCAGTLLLSTGCAKLKSRDDLNKGVQAYKSNHYADAVKHFQEAVELDPSNSSARLYLAVSYMIQWVPGAETPENKRNHDMAVKTFNEILAKEPTNSMALAYMASMAYSSATTGTEEQKKVALEEAKSWNQKRIEADPKESEAYYYLGVINWAEAFTAIREASAAEKLKPDDPGPLKDAKVREDLKGKYLNMINQGLDDLQKCLSIDKENEDAMQYMNLLLREKAKIEDTPEAAKADVAQAEDWSNKGLDMRKIKASRPAKKETT